MADIAGIGKWANDPFEMRELRFPLKNALSWLDNQSSVK